MGNTTILQKLTNFEALKAYIKNHEDEFVTVAENELGELQSCYINILKDIDVVVAVNLSELKILKKHLFHFLCEVNAFLVFRINFQQNNKNNIGGNKNDDN